MRRFQLLLVFLLTVCTFSLIRPPKFTANLNLRHCTGNALDSSLPHPLECSFQQLTSMMNGSGKAKTIWKSLRRGENPLELKPTVLSEKAKLILRSILCERPLVPTTVNLLTSSDCGTRKFLCDLEDGNRIESVLIPSTKFDRTTLCVSTQVGCDRGCIFCATGKMGIQRNLTTCEILGQVYHGLKISRQSNMPNLTNIVFMGMGDAGRSIDAVGQAVNCLTDRDRFCFAQSKVTVSTVGPSPEIFATLAGLPCGLAWSLHAARDDLRRKLVPSTRHSTIELRDGLISALSTRRTIKQRTLMIAVTLVNGSIYTKLSFSCMHLHLFFVTYLAAKFIDPVIFY